MAPEEVRSALEKILNDPLFEQSNRLGRFLRYTVECTLDGKTDTLKEYVIGTDVYDRKPPYHPSQDSIVRTEAQRLRAKLREYYETSGKNDPVFLYFRPGSYVPIFRRNKDFVKRTLQDHKSTDLLVEGSGVIVAVLPFSDLSGDSETAAFARSMADELVHALTYTDGLRVVSAAVVPQLLTGSSDISSLVARVGLQAIIDGTTKREGQRLRVTIRVSDAAGFQLSSHRFETEVSASPVTQIQEQIASAFVSRARPEQSHIRRWKASASKVMLAAYPLVVQAEALLDEGSAVDIKAALTKFEDATRIAPTYARSFCGISYCHTEMAVRGATPSSDVVSRAKEAALRSIELDPEMIDAHACLGATLALEWEWKESERSFQRAVDLGPHPTCLREYALVLGALGRRDEASHYMGLANDIDPFSSRQKVARAKFFHISRQFELGIELLSGPAIYGPIPAEAVYLLALMHIQLGHSDIAGKLCEQFEANSAAHPTGSAAVAELLALTGRKEQAAQVVAERRFLDVSYPMSNFRKALLCLALGQETPALSFLESSVKAREAEAVWLAVDPRIDPMRGLPQYRELKGRVFGDVQSL